MDKKGILEVLYSRGIKRTVGLVRKTKVKGVSNNKEAHYYILPMIGEPAPDSSKTWEQVYQGKVWTIARRDRDPPEVELVDSVDGPTINWRMGEAIEGAMDYPTRGVKALPAPTAPVITIDDGEEMGGLEIVAKHGGERMGERGAPVHTAVDSLVLRMDKQDSEAKEEREGMKGLLMSMLKTLDTMGKRFDALENKGEGKTDV